MVVTSKQFFERVVGDSRCHEFIHPWTENCLKGNQMMLASCIKGSYKFYAAVYILQILMKSKKLNKAELLKQLKMYVKSGIFGFIVGTFVVTYNCIVRNLFFSRLYYYNTLFLPSAISGLALHLEPMVRRILITNLFANLVFEYWIRTLDMKGYLRRSAGKETVLFMLGSAVFYYLLRKEGDNEKRTPLLWIFIPPRVSKETCEPMTGIKGRSPACPHSGNCINYILKGTLKLFGAGCAMTIVRQIVPRIMTPAKAIKSVKLSSLKLGLFFGGYIGIYRLIVCLLCRANGRDSALYALPAGFLAGAAFRASPSLGISLMPITSSLQILSSWAFQSGLIPAHWPLMQITFCLSQALLFHARIMHYEACPKYIVNLMDSVTNKRTEEVYKNFEKRCLANM